MWIVNLNPEQCREVLEASRVARLACCRDNQPYVVPIHYAYADESLYAFSLPGKKIDCMRANPLVSVLVEQHGEGRQWRSVLVDGRFQVLPDRIGQKKERERAWSVLSRYSHWWLPGELKPVSPPPEDIGHPVFFKISITQMSGRAAKE